jgi:hypothetical protein
VRLKSYQQSSYYTCVNIYNKLPDELAKLISNKKPFLQQLKQYLIDHQLTGNIFAPSILIGRSFMYNENKNGSRTDR